MVSAVVLVSLLLWLHRRSGGKAWAQKQLQSPTVQTQSVKGCQDLVLFRIRNTEPQKTVKSNRGLLSPVTGGTQMAVKCGSVDIGRYCSTHGKQGHALSRTACCAFSTKQLKEAVNGYKVSNPLHTFFPISPGFGAKRKFLLSSHLILQTPVGLTVPPTKPFKLLINFYWI